MPFAFNDQRRCWIKHVSVAGLVLVGASALISQAASAEQGKSSGKEGKSVMLADGSANFAKALGLEMDITARGMGVRSQRYALVAEDGKVTHLGVEPPGGFEASTAETTLAAL